MNARLLDAGEDVVADCLAAAPEEDVWAETVVGEAFGGVDEGVARES